MRRKNQDSPQAFRHVPAHNIPIDAVREIHQVFHRIWHPIEKGRIIHIAAGMRRAATTATTGSVFGSRRLSTGKNSTGWKNPSVALQYPHAFPGDIARDIRCLSLFPPHIPWESARRPKFTLPCRAFCILQYHVHILPPLLSQKIRVRPGFHAQCANSAVMDRANDLTQARDVFPMHLVVVGIIQGILHMSSPLYCAQHNALHKILLQEGIHQQNRHHGNKNLRRGHVS